MPCGSEANFEQRIRQLLFSVHLFIEIEKSFAYVNCVLERHGELQLLMQVVDRPVKGLVAFHHQICSSFEPVDEIRQTVKPPGIGHEVSQPRRRQSVQRDIDKLSQRSQRRLIFERGIPGVYLTPVREGKQVETQVIVFLQQAIEIVLNE